MEQSIHSFRKDIQKLKNKKNPRGLLDYEEAMELIREFLSEKLKSIMDIQGEEKQEVVIKDKKYLRKKIQSYRSYIQDIMLSNNIRVRDYEEEKADDFITEMANEFAGYSILSPAFEDPAVSDIYTITWDSIFIEKNGKNEKYPYTFRSPKHYKETIERLLREAGKQINLGDKPIVDFELYGDRGCATSPRVSPKDYTMSIRKHAEDQITKQQLIKAGVINEKMDNLLEILFSGERNIIYAGITGSGKTTTIRALIDDYITKANKRMFLAEDTPELYPKNEHTIGMVAVKSDDQNVRISLGQLIYTALRLKPKYIIVGEVRGEEAQAAVEGMETGHSTICTMHGGNPWNIINRLVTKYLMAMPSLGIDVVERIIGSSLDYICIQDDIPGIGRKCTSISEVVYNFEKRRVELKTICSYDFKTQDFVFKGKISRDKADSMMRRGVSWERLSPWIEEETKDVA